MEAEAVNTYIKTLQEIKKRKEWKKGSDATAMFGQREENDFNHVKVNDIQSAGTSKVVYAAELEHTTALYIKKHCSRRRNRTIAFAKK